MNKLQYFKHLYQINIVLLIIAVLSACAAHHKSSLYEQIGGQATVEKLADAFITEIQYDKATLAFFLDSDIDRFREKFIEHTCAHIEGPCNYTGDSMKQVHQGMNIGEADFNRIVELLIKAMTNVDIPHRYQNQILARLAPMRSDIIYQ